MPSALSRIPIAARRRLAATLVLFAALFLAVGAVAATGRGSSAAMVFSAIALVVAVVLGLTAWGVGRSIRIDRDEHRLDAAIEDVMAAHGGHSAMCGCGHEHDPDELHVTDAEVQAQPCAHDGAGAACAHDCESCVLAALRPTP
ncbi:MAG: hypothetical protein ACRDVG_03025 [Jatrophihabitantaceae bacterium]